jgi:acyl carrier protein
MSLKIVVSPVRFRPSPFCEAHESHRKPFLPLGGLPTRRTRRREIDTARASLPVVESERPQPSWSTEHPRGDRESVLDDLRTYLGARYSRPPETIPEEAELQGDLGATSIELVELAIAAEDRWGVPLAGDGVPPLRTVGEVADYLAAVLERTRTR